MSAESQIEFRRGGASLGTFDKFEARQKVASGEILLWDEAVDPVSGEVQYLLPPYRRTWRVFDWADEEDLLWYYVRDGYIHGPRMLEELWAMLDSEFLTPQTLITTLGGDTWLPFEEAFDLDPSAKDHANDAIRQLMDSNPIGAGVSGFKALGKFFGGAPQE